MKDGLDYRQIKKELLVWVGELIKKRMEELKLSEPRLEALTGIGASTISDYRNGKYLPNLEKAVTLFIALEINPSFLWAKIEPLMK